MSKIATHFTVLSMTALVACGGGGTGVNSFSPEEQIQRLDRTQASVLRTIDESPFELSASLPAEGSATYRGSMFIKTQAPEPEAGETVGVETPASRIIASEAIMVTNFNTNRVSGRADDFVGADKSAFFEAIRDDNDQFVQRPTQPRYTGGTRYGGSVDIAGDINTQTSAVTATMLGTLTAGDETVTINNNIAGGLYGDNQDILNLEGRQTGNRADGSGGTEEIETTYGFGGRKR